ncbi:GumC family protein [Salinimicrobium sediminilitoris]|uniref:GumC family protein n=1 Tax=Salinimicrobium sediminilitoris TaxID=2876715 RepID=UPI001E35C6D2|nr:polysaccharide biosynthesis tyrosine autokinase [Salinimicrobium sediminilitoris]MCC8358441.1 polysaccharide biosynthesis tyrosine autokinase [Salinimicrobium sediminilitoris]
MSQNNNPTKNNTNDINIREELEKYLKYWPWFLLCVVLALGFAYLKLRQTTPVYSTTATILIKDGSSQNSEMAAFAELGIFDGMNSNSIENEIGILRSRRLMKSVVKELDINIRYFDVDQLRSPELYLKSPFIAEVLLLDEEKLLETSERNFHIEYLGNDKVKISNLISEKMTEANLGSPVDLGFAQVLLVRNELLSEEAFEENRPILLQFAPAESVANHYRNDLSVQLKDYNSSLVELKLNDPIRKKAEDILDQLVLEYNREAIDDKNLVALNTAKFIDERLDIISEELDSVETGKVEFKESNRLTDIEAESQLFMSNASEFKKRQQELDTQIELVNAMLAYLRSSSMGDLLPANLGIEESAVNTSIGEYNELVLERNRILSGSTERNPVVIKLNRQIEELKSNVLQSLNRLKSNLEIAESNLNREAAAIGSRIAGVPSKEKQFRGIERQQQIKETLYLFLLQKREETSISLAVTEPKAKIVDSAFSSGVPISPNPRSTYLTALLLGLGLPFGIIYLKNLLNNKISNRSEVESLIQDIPVVGEIPKIAKGNSDLIEQNDRSVLAESFRILHTNLQYLLVNSNEKQTGISILVTSTVKGEGKTFTAFNLAITLANTGKKVVIVGGDLRNPQLQRYEPESKSWPGVSDYLANRNLKLKELIKRSTLHPDLDLLTSGSIPPNPSELLRQEKAKLLFRELEGQYDYVIIDTAPSMLVADTFLINQYADITLYMIRAGYTERKLLDFAAGAKRDGKLKDVSFVLNNVEAEQFGYGNKYGYYYAYGEEHKSLWNRIKNKAAFW